MRETSRRAPRRRRRARAGRRALLDAAGAGALVVACDASGERARLAEFAAWLQAERETARGCGVRDRRRVRTSPACREPRAQRLSFCAVDASPRARAAGPRRAALPRRHHRARRAVSQVRSTTGTDARRSRVTEPLVRHRARSADPRSRAPRWRAASAGVVRAASRTARRRWRRTRGVAGEASVGRRGRPCSRQRSRRLAPRRTAGERCARRGASW